MPVHTALEARLLHIAKVSPGTTVVEALSRGLLDGTSGRGARPAHATAKRAAAKLREEGLLWQARPAMILLNPKWEGSLTGASNQMLAAARTLGPTPQPVFLEHELLDGIASSARPLVLKGLRDRGAIYAWDALVPRPQ